MITNRAEFASAPEANPTEARYQKRATRYLDKRLNKVLGATKDTQNHWALTALDESQPTSWHNFYERWAGDQLQQVALTEVDGRLIAAELVWLPRSNPMQPPPFRPGYRFIALEQPPTTADITYDVYGIPTLQGTPLYRQ